MGNVISEDFKKVIFTDEVVEELNEELKEAPNEMPLWAFLGICAGMYMKEEVGDLSAGATVGDLKKKELTADDICNLLEEATEAFYKYGDKFRDEEGELNDEKFIQHIREKLAAENES